MNYITRLQSELAESNAARAAVAERITDFLAYLESPKFHDDPTIQSSEVHRFLMSLRMDVS